ncbi:hypothetical protein COLSTE_01687 [Collinsella stercoris DSM 13279]|uniref:Uncharacterized protein n=1 Tax=Collinsella stercoris DSM 13279 TaxID=445975 RepID=B6GC69_9ACTN|nr:hypothetical protein COLSTE_01687 [Collinsella stercoris DSM 13279]
MVRIAGQTTGIVPMGTRPRSICGRKRWHDRRPILHVPVRVVARRFHLLSRSPRMNIKTDTL